MKETCLLTAKIKSLNYEGWNGKYNSHRKTQLPSSKSYIAHLNITSIKLVKHNLIKQLDYSIQVLCVYAS